MKFIPSLPQLVKGLIITAISLIVIRFMPAQVKAYILGS